MGALILLAVTFLLMWVLFILPQQRRLRAHQALVSRLEVGDEVMATSGLFGTIVELDDEVVRLEVAPGTVVRLARGAVARRLDDDAVPEEPVTPAPAADAETEEI
jgi:preprotein translocase subunit YajC